MAQQNQIYTWFRNLDKVSEDDKQDLKILLMDEQNTSDAGQALHGLVSNLLERGWKEDVMLLLLDGAGKEACDIYRAVAIGFAEFVLIIHDSRVRQSYAVQEKLLDLISENHDLFFKTLLMLYQAKRHIMTIGAPLDIQGSLLYRLVVVGKENQSKFK